MCLYITIFFVSQTQLLLIRLHPQSLFLYLNYRKLFITHLSSPLNLRPQKKSFLFQFYLRRLLRCNFPCLLFCYSQQLMSCQKVQIGMFNKHRHMQLFRNKQSKTIYNTSNTLLNTTYKVLKGIFRILHCIFSKFHSCIHYKLPNKCNRFPTCSNRTV